MKEEIHAYSLEPWKLLPLKMVAFIFDKKDGVVGAKQVPLLNSIIAYCFLYVVVVVFSNWTFKEYSQWQKGFDIF